MTSAPAGPHHVVIVGAGFGGLEAVFGLAGAPVQITLVDRRNHHLFQPLLYQVATTSLNGLSELRVSPVTRRAASSVNQRSASRFRSNVFTVSLRRFSSEGIRAW